MAKIYRWIYIILAPFGDGQDGYVIGQSLIHYKTRDECVKAAKEWLKTASYDACSVTKGPYLIVESVDGAYHWI